MMRHRLITNVAIAALCGASHYHVANAELFTVNITSYAPTGLPGFTGYTFQIVPMFDTVNPVTSVEGHFVSLSGMNQLNPPNPFNMNQPLDTVDSQNNGLLTFITGDMSAPEKDSQFEISLAGSLQLVRNENSTSLSGATGGLFTPRGPLPFVLAHVVVPSNAGGTWSIKITQNFVEQPNAGLFGTAVPEVSQVVLGALASVTICGLYLCRRLANPKAKVVSHNR